MGTGSNRELLCKGGYPGTATTKCCKLSVARSFGISRASRTLLISKNLHLVCIKSVYDFIPNWGICAIQRDKGKEEQQLLVI